jgi:hypothetical protein
MTETRKALAAGLAELIRHQPTSFTVAGRMETFVGRFDDGAISNTVGEGGFLVEGTARLIVPRETFEAVEYTPRRGERVAANGSEWVVISVEPNAIRYELGLQSPHQ